MFLLIEINQKNMFQAFAFAALTAVPVLHSFTTNHSQMVINSFTDRINDIEIKKKIRTLFCF